MDENYLFYFILFYFIFQCGAHKQKELKKNRKENLGMISLTFQKEKRKGKTKKRKRKILAAAGKDFYGRKNFVAYIYTHADAAKRWERN